MEYRKQGVASSLTKETAKDAAFLIGAELAFQHLACFRKLKGDGAEVISMHLDIEAHYSSEIDEALVRLFSQNMSYQLENEIAELPYFARSDFKHN